MKLPAFIGENVPLAPLTTFGIGGAARWLARPADSREVAQTLAIARDLGVPVLVLGGGSNVLVSDGGVEAMVLRLDDAGEFAAMERLDGAAPSWRVGAAAPLGRFVSLLAHQGVRGLEALAGIPGRVGGAVAMNAGGGGSDIGLYVAGAEAYAFSGEALNLDRDGLAFSYRRSGLRDLLAVRFTFAFLRIDRPDVVEADMRDRRAAKAEKQPLAFPSAGCVFRNPPGEAAGALLDRAGCKGMAEGGARVSERHANFIVRDGDASSRDVARLAARMRRAVWERFGVSLELEIVLWGDDPDFLELTRPL